MNQKVFDFRFHKPTLSDDFRMKGRFWAPGNSARKVPGTIIYSPTDGIHLELESTLRRGPTRGKQLPFARLRPQSDNSILSLLDGDIPVSLLKCFFTSSGVRTTYYANTALFGAHYRKFSAVKFNSFDLAVTYLEDW